MLERYTPAASDRFLMIKSYSEADDKSTVEGQLKINIVLNWFKELK